VTQPPAILTYGTLKWWVAAFLADTTADTNDIPDLKPVNGSAFIVADIAEDGLFISQDTDTPLTILKTRMELLIVDGHLQDRAGNRQVKVLACDSPGLSQKNWPYVLSFELDDGLTFGSFPFYVYTDEIVDLTQRAPFELVNGELITKGDPGEAATVTVGEVITVEPDQPADVDNSGTVSDAVFNFYIPKGRDGTDGRNGESYGGGFIVPPVDPGQPLELTVQSRWGISTATGETYYNEDGVVGVEAALVMPDPFTGNFILFKPGEPVPDIGEAKGEQEGVIRWNGSAWKFNGVTVTARPTAGYESYRFKGGTVAPTFGATGDSWESD